MMANHSMRVYCYVLAAIFVSFLPAAVYAQSEIMLDVEMDEYSLGDHIVFTLSVPNKLHESATLTILHNLQTVNSVELVVMDKISTYTSPDPIDSFYLPGNWMMQIEYGNMSATDVFTILESDTVLLPLWFKNIVTLWSSEVISDVDYGEYLFLLYNVKILDSPVPAEIQSATIPDWFKNLSTELWLDGHIDDSSYINIIDYLLEEIIVLE